MKVNFTSKISTFYWKIFWPIFIVIGLSITLYSVIINNEEFLYDSQFLLFGSLFMLYVLYNTHRLKFVKGDDGFLYVKNYKKQIKVALSNLLKVTESKFSLRIITIEFKKETEFGKKISFIPYSKWFLFGSTHPVTKELQNYIETNKAKDLPLV